MATPLFNAGLTVHTQSHDYPIIITEKVAVQKAPWRHKLRLILAVSRY